MATFWWIGGAFLLGAFIGAYSASLYWARLVNEAVEALADVPGFEALKK
jgi:hypothetical protein